MLKTTDPLRKAGEREDSTVREYSGEVVWPFTFGLSEKKMKETMK